MFTCLTLHDIWHIFLKEMHSHFMKHQHLLPNSSTYQEITQNVEHFTVASHCVTISPAFHPSLLGKLTLNRPFFHKLIYETMLVARGSLDARTPFRKFVILYTLWLLLLLKLNHCKLSLRSIKSILVITASLKKTIRVRPKDQVLIKPLQDFNTPD